MHDPGGHFTVDERRKSNRIDAHDEGLKVVNTFDRQAVGVVGNLSRTGMMLISSRELYSNGILQLDIETPSAFGGKPISIGFKVLWCTPANSPEQYWAGLDIIDIGERERESLGLLLEYLAR
jgi:hypothetical protein